MTFYNSFKKTASNVLNNIVEPHMNKFAWVKEDLKKSNMGVMLREYISMCFFASILMFIIVLPASFSVLLLLGNPLLFSIFFAVIITIVATLSILIFALEYPAAKASDRKRSIDNNLPFACLYMNTIASTGAPPYLIFKLLADFKEYGEVSTEARDIVENVEVMGQDIEVAMKRIAEQTPSEEFKDLLWGMVTTIVRGGDLRTMLQEKSKLLMEKYRRTISAYTDSVSMYVEIYITLVIVGSIFAIVMMTVMGAISGFTELKPLQMIMVYVFLPVSAIVFIALLRLSSPIS